MPGFRGTLHEFKQGALHSGSKHGPIVTNRKQAIAIAFSQGRKEGEHLPKKKSVMHRVRDHITKRSY